MKTMRWLLLGVTLLALVPVAADTGNPLQPLSGLTVCDSKGKTVGGVIEGAFYLSHVPVVALKAGDQVVTVGAKPNYLVGNDQIVFATPDCSGTPYFVVPTSLGYLPTLIPQSFVTNEGTLYTPGAGSSPLTVNVLSSWQTEFPPPPAANACYSPYELAEVSVVEAQAVGDLNAMFQPPFALRSFGWVRGDRPMREASSPER